MSPFRSQVIDNVHEVCVCERGISEMFDGAPVNVLLIHLCKHTSIVS